MTEGVEFLELGYILLSKKVLRKLAHDQNFACFLGGTLGKHAIKKTTLIDMALNQGIQIKSHVGNLVAITEKDKNNMPRTTVVFWDEAGGV